MEKPNEQAKSRLKLTPTSSALAPTELLNPKTNTIAPVDRGNRLLSLVKMETSAFSHQRSPLSQHFAIQNHATCYNAGNPRNAVAPKSKIQNRNNSPVLYPPNPDRPPPAPMIQWAQSDRANTNAEGQRFTDIRQHWAQQCIVRLAEQKRVSGYPDRRFRPDSSLTRAELAVLMLNAFPNFPATRNPSSFADVPTTHWAYSAIRQASAKGFLVGYPDGRFQSDRVVPRVQAIAAISSAIPQLPNAATDNLDRLFQDAAEIPNWVKPAIARATAGFLVVNYPNVARLQPNRAVTRGEIVALLCRALAIDAVPPEYIAGFPRPATRARPIFDRPPEIIHSYFGTPIRETTEGERRIQYFLSAGIWQLFPEWTRGGEFAVVFVNNRSTTILLNPDADPSFPNGTFAYDPKKVFEYIFGYAPKTLTDYPGWYGGGHEGFYIYKKCLGDGVVTSYMSSLLGDTDVSLSYNAACEISNQ